VEGLMPVAGVDYPARFAQLTSWFPDDEACASYLARLRWPDGFRSPRCGCPTSWETAAGLWLCRSCRRKTSVTAGTIFHRSRLPLTDWFAAVWFVTTQKSGVSALSLQRVLGWAPTARPAHVALPGVHRVASGAMVETQSCLPACSAAGWPTSRTASPCST